MVGRLKTLFYNEQAENQPLYLESLKSRHRDFPGGPVVKNPPYNAGHAGSIPGQGTKIPHAMGQLSLCATTTELTHLN